MHMYGSYALVRNETDQMGIEALENLDLAPLTVHGVSNARVLHSPLFHHVHLVLRLIVLAEIVPKKLMIQCLFCRYTFFAIQVETPLKQADTKSFFIVEAIFFPAS